MPNIKKEPLHIKNESQVDAKFQDILKNRNAHFLEENEKKLSEEFEELKKTITYKIANTPGEKIECNITKYSRMTIDKMIKYLQENNLTFVKEEPLHPEFGDDPRNKNDLILIINLPPKAGKVSSLGMFSLKNVGEDSLFRKHISAEYKAKIQKNEVHEQYMKQLAKDFYSGKIGIEDYIEKWADNMSKGPRLLSIDLSERSKKECESVVMALQGLGYQAELQINDNDFAPTTHTIHVSVDGRCEEDYAAPTPTCSIQ